VREMSIDSTGLNVMWLFPSCQVMGVLIFELDVLCLC
jgi:hypothetical protein